MRLLKNGPEMICAEQKSAIQNHRRKQTTDRKTELRTR